MLLLMFKLALAIAGAESTAESLRKLDRLYSKPPRKLMAALGQEWKALFRGRINQATGDFAPLAPLTLRLREELGYAPGPILRRSGSLVNEIDVLRAEDGLVEVGARDETGRAVLLQFGGQTSPSSRYPNRPVPARPFVALEDQEIEDSLTTLVELLEEAER